MPVFYQDRFFTKAEQPVVLIAASYEGSLDSNIQYCLRKARGVWDFSNGELNYDSFNLAALIFFAICENYKKTNARIRRP